MNGTIAAPAVAAPAVELRAVAKRFGPTVALHRLDLQIRKGEFFSLLGPSGCGKTTTLNLIGGFETASEGEIAIDGRPMQAVPPHRRPVNTVFQNYALFPHMDVAGNIGFGLRMRGVPAAERERQVQEMLRLVSLDGLGARRPAQLSGGQRQRVALARALVNRPSVLLLDEPLGALDLKLRRQMQAELTRIQRQVGITFVYVTHDQEEAMAMSDRIAVMDQGRLLQVGTPAEIYAQPASRAVMSFIGSVNVLPGRMAAGGDVELPGLGLGLVPAAATAAPPPGQPVELLVRPEHLHLSADAAAAPHPPLRAQLLKTARLGFVTHCTLRLADGRELLAFRLDGAPALPLAAGGEPASVFLWWDRADARAWPAAAAAAVPSISPVVPEGA
jgi:spermidine/putrescine transport system ATP-binding protein